jgi:hypothetical protein
MPLLENKKYVLCKIDNLEYCVINGQFNRYLSSINLSLPQYLENHEGIRCRCLYCGSYAGIKTGFIPKDTCGSVACGKAARARAIREAGSEKRKEWNAAPAQRRRTDPVLAKKINDATHAGNLKVGADGLTGYERTAKKRQNTLLGKYGHAYYANWQKTKRTWAEKSDEEKDAYATKCSKTQLGYTKEKRCTINAKIISSAIEKYGMACPANKAVHIGASKVASMLFEQLDKPDAMFKPKCKEHRIETFAVDYCVDNKVIEFFGDWWHGNPKKFKPTQRVGRGKILVSEIWQKDAERIKKIEAAGYHVKIVWERDFRRHPERVIKECREWLSST